MTSQDEMSKKLEAARTKIQDLWRFVYAELGSNDGLIQNLSLALQRSFDESDHTEIPYEDVMASLTFMKTRLDSLMWFHDTSIRDLLTHFEDLKSLVTNANSSL